MRGSGVQSGMAGDRGASPRVGLLAAVVVISLSLGLVPAYGQSAAEQAREAKGRMSDLRKSFSAATEAYLDARYRWNQTQADLSKTRAELEWTKNRLAYGQKVLGMRVSHLYRTPDLGYVEVVLGATDFDDFIVGWTYLARIGLADARLVREMKALKRRMRSQERRLAGLEGQQRARAADAGAKANTLEVQLAAQRETYTRLRRAAAVEAQVQSQGAAAGGYGSINLSQGFTFPVAGPHSYSNDWGNPRSGGRTHKGTDIFADFGTPAVAVVSGSVSSKEGGLGGRTIWLSGNDGNEYYYAHLQGWEVTGGSVSQGQVVGYVGNTGNASGGAPHLHFEVHPGGGSAINPYPILVAAD